MKNILLEDDERNYIKKKLRNCRIKVNKHQTVFFWLSSNTNSLTFYKYTN